jgi:acyl-CoA synthetase (NDP forming)
MIAPDKLAALFRPTSVAVVGASDDIGKPGGRCLTFLRRSGFAGPIYPINPRIREIDGLPCYPDLAALPGPADMVVLLVPAAQIPGHLRTAGRAGTRCAVVCSSGFAEAGPEGARLQDDLVRAAAETGMAVLGPNCLGLADLHAGLIASFSTALETTDNFRAGPIAFLSQSGAIGVAVFTVAQNEGIGFGKFLSTGNEAVLNFADFLDHLAGDADVSLVLGYIEGVRDGRGFVAAARRARAAGTSVAMLKVGQSDAGVRAARSHTGAMVGSAQVYEAAFRRAGVLAVADIRSLLDLALVLPARQPVRGPRVGIVSMSGGAGVMMADRATASGLTLATFGEAMRQELEAVLRGFSPVANPLDYGAIYGSLDAVRRCFAAVAADPGVDVVIVFIGLSPHLAGVIEPILEEIQIRYEKPVVVAWLGGPRHGLTGLRDRGVPAFDDPSRAVDAVAQLVRSAVPLPAHDDAPTERAAETRATLAAFAASGRTTLTEREVKALLAPYGVPVVGEALARTPAEAEQAAKNFGGRVAIKAEAPALLHKSDAGAVRLDVAADAAAAAFTAVVQAATAVVGAAGVAGAVVQPMAPAGLEVLAGLRHDPQFGPTITVGLGGVASEALGDVATELAPVDLAAARAMLARLRGARLLGPFRGAAARDTEALAAALVALGRFAIDAGPLLAELDLNPVIVLAAGQGCLAVDGAAVLAAPTETVTEETDP